MKIHCNHCHKTYSADANLKAVPDSAPEELNGQWATICPFCHEETLTDIEQKSIYAILSEDDIDNRHFEDFFDGECVKEAFGFDTVEEFITWWEKAVDEQPSMWYHVIRDGIQICAGAIDPYDIDIFRENFPELAEFTACQESIYWTGADDIRSITESGCYQDEL